MATDTESVLAFVTRHYEDLKNQAQDDNKPPDPPNDKITAVIIVINELYETIKKGGASHDEIVEQLQEIKKQYSALDLDIDSYTRYTEATTSLNTIVDGFNEVDAGVGSEGEGEGEGVDAG